MSSGKWDIRGYDRATAVGLYRSGFTSLVSVLLASRGVRNMDDYARIYDCSGRKLADPMTLTDMDKAVARIKSAISAGERIAVYGDYDVDGMTALAVLSAYLGNLGCDHFTYIPERLSEGYGVKQEALDRLKQMGADLVVTVDCGITAAAEVEYAKSIGIDMVITDHHQLGETLPQAVAVVNPKRDGEEHPCYDLAGVGVAFMLVCALAGSPEDVLDRYGDLVALGTIADVMPVLGENRYIICRGMEIMRNSPRPGIRALCKASGINLSQLNTNSVGFTLAPRLNAAGRLGCTDLSVRLLTTNDEVEAEELAASLCELNRQRQAIESEVFRQAMDFVPAQPDGPVVAAGADWHQGVAGIVASKLSDRCKFPAVVICVKDGVGHGSCRCQGDFCFVDALTQCADLLINYGGHRLAAGLTIEEKNIPAFTRKLRECYREQGCSTYTPSLDVDFEVIQAAILSEENIEGLKVLEPFGNQNPQPVLCMRNVVVDMVTALRGGRATKLWLRRDGECFEGMLFSHGGGRPDINDGDIIDIVFTPGINEYRGRRSVQLVIKDYCRHS